MCIRTRTAEVQSRAVRGRTTPTTAMVEHAVVRPRNSAYQIAFGNREVWHLDGDRPRRYVAVQAMELFLAMTRTATEQRHCPFCRLPMQVCGTPEADHELYCVGDSDLIGFGLEVCPRCACWRFWSANYQCMDEPLYVVAASVAAQFNPELPDGCAAELAQALRQSPHRWHETTPTGLERFVANIFRANYGPCEVMHMGGTGDGGIDVLFIRGDGIRVPIQVKRRASPLKHESVSTIRELLGTMTIEGVRTGIVVSTATGFTAPAVDAAAAARKQGYVVELVNRSILDEMVGPLVPHRPWQNLFERPELEVAVPLLQPLVEEGLCPGQIHMWL